MASNMTDNRTIRLSELERAREYVASSMHDRDKSWGDLVRKGERDDCPEMRMVLKAMASEAALSALPAVDGWKSIESAPKDGTEIVLFGLYPENDQGLPTKRVTSGWWLVPDAPVIGDCGGVCRCPEYGEPEAPHWASMHGGSSQGWMSTDGGFTEEWPPLKWMPLPAPPIE